MSLFKRWQKTDGECTLNLCTSYTHGAVISISKDEDEWMNLRMVTLSKNDLRQLILTAVKLLGDHSKSKISMFAVRDDEPPTIDLDLEKPRTIRE